MTLVYLKIEFLCLNNIFCDFVKKKQIDNDYLLKNINDHPVKNIFIPIENRKRKSYY